MRGLSGARSGGIPQECDVRAPQKLLHRASPHIPPPPTVSLVLPGESPTELRARALRDRELRLRRVLERLRDKRRLMRRERVRREFPVVSVVGYTNCGEEGGVHKGGCGACLGG